MHRADALGSLRAAERHCAAAGDAVAAARRELRSVGAVPWDGRAADAFRGVVADLLEEVGRAAARVDEAHDAARALVRLAWQP